VAVARAIAVGPSVLLMDEPLSNLDALLRLNFRSDLKRLVRDLRTTTVYVTHDQVEALSLGDRVAVMRDGAIVQCDSPMKVYDRPATRFVGGFIGNPPMNFLDTTIEREGEAVLGRVGEHTFAVPDELAGLAGQRLLAGIRAENLRAESRQSAGALAAKVEVVEPLGSQVMVTLPTGGAVLKMLTGNDFQSGDADELWVRPVTDKIRWFDANTGVEIHSA
jgi:multiple sugar transport system ATP-binding protein